MIRRNARLRSEYIYRKSLEGKEKQMYEHKRAVQKAMDEGKPIPTELKRESDKIMNEIDLDDERTKQLRTHVDDEYRFAGVKDPKILLTTSRSPSARLSQFAKEVKLLFPNSQRLNRGHEVVSHLVEVARTNDFTDIVIVHETRGQPDGLIISHMPFGPTAYFGLSNTVLRHDIVDSDLGSMSEAFPHLIFDNFESDLGERLKNILKYCFPVPKLDSRRVITFANRNDTISFRHHVYKKLGYKEIDLVEVGPRFEMKLYQIRLGTIDMQEAENEWVLRPYMNAAKKRTVL